MNLHILTVKCNQEPWPVMTGIFKIKPEITKKLFSTTTSKPQLLNACQVQTPSAFESTRFQQLLEWNEFRADAKTD